MVRKIGTAWGLNVRMVLTMFLLACLYLGFMAALAAFGVRFGFIVVIAAVLLIAQYYFSDQLILLSLGAREVFGQEAPQLPAMAGPVAAMTCLPQPPPAHLDSSGPNATATRRN